MAVMPMIIKELILHTGGVCRASPGTRGEMNYDGGPYIEYFWVKFNGKKQKIEAEKSYGSIIQFQMANFVAIVSGVFSKRVFILGVIVNSFIKQMVEHFAWIADEVHERMVNSGRTKCVL